LGDTRAQWRIGRWRNLSDRAKANHQVGHRNLFRYWIHERVRMFRPPPRSLFLPRIQKSDDMVEVLVRVLRESRHDRLVRGEQHLRTVIAGMNYLSRIAYESAKPIRRYLPCHASEVGAYTILPKIVTRTAVAIEKLASACNGSGVRSDLVLIRLAAGRTRCKGNQNPKHHTEKRTRDW